jgi:hypothetical protein
VPIIFPPKIALNVVILFASAVVITGKSITFTTQLSFLLPSFVVTVMTASPLLTAVTNPLSLTVATAELLLSHIISLLSALRG